MKLDDLLIHVGELGRYQAMMFVTIGIAAIPVSMNMMMSVYTTPTLKARCAIPSLPNDTYEVQGAWHELLINRTVPWEEEEGKWSLSTCKLYASDVNTTVYDVNTSAPLNTSSHSCSRWVYDKSIFSYTATEKFDMVCDNKSYKTYAQMLMMVGVLLGSIVMGQASDLIGRKKVLLFNIGLMVTTGVAAIFPSNFWAYAGVRLLNGITSAGIFLVLFVMCLEIAGPNKRVYAGLVPMTNFALGFFVLTFVSYFLRNWEDLHVAAIAPWAVLLMYICVVPESMRWLMSKGKFEDAEKIVRKVAKTNRRLEKLPEEIFEESDKDSVQTASILSVLKHKVLCLRALNVFFNWFVNTIVFYGISLNSGNLGGSIFVNFTLTGVAELLSYAFLVFALNRWGRKWPLCLTMVIGGLACISTLFVVIYADPENNKGHNAIIVVLSLVGMFCISASFAIIYVFTAELFPTVVRNASMGASSMCARVGGIISPYIADLSLLIKTDLGKALPLVIMGSLAVLAGCLAMLLPETHGTKLPETIEEGIKFGKEPVKKDGAQENKGYYNFGHTIRLKKGQPAYEEASSEF